MTLQSSADHKVQESKEETVEAPAEAWEGVGACLHEVTSSDVVPESQGSVFGSEAAL